MKILFTKCDTIVSKMIRYLLDEPVSHVAIQFGNYIIHSDITGVKIEWYEKYLKDNEIVYSIDYNTHISSDIILSQSWEGEYDFHTLLYFFWRAFLKKIFKRPFPKTNKLGKNYNYICTEMIMFLPIPHIKNRLSGVDLEMVTPYGLYLLLTKK